MSRQTTRSSLIMKFWTQTWRRISTAGNPAQISWRCLGIKGSQQRHAVNSGLLGPGDALPLALGHAILARSLGIAFASFGWDVGTQPIRFEAGERVECMAKRFTNYLNAAKDVHGTENMR